jgi:integrase
MRLSDREILRLACPPGKKDILLFDDTLQGFGVRVTRSARIFIAQYRIGSIIRRTPLGRFGEITTKQGRDKALVILGAAKDGRDPVGERQARIRQKAAEALQARAKVAEDAFTLDRLIDAWIVDLEKRGRRERYARNAAAALRNHFQDYLHRPATSLTQTEAAHRLEEIGTTAGPIASNRVRAYAKAAYNRGIKRQLVKANPFDNVDRVAAEKSRDRVLNDAEIGAIWNAAGTLPRPYDGFVRLLLLTGQRRDEVSALRWEELSPDLTIWVLPAERTKTEMTHIVALSDAAQDILRVQPRIQDCPYVLPGERLRGPINGFGLAKRRLDKALDKAIPPWTFHDFRRSMASWMASAGISSDVADRALNHTQGRYKGVKGIYQRYEYLPERKAALIAWSEHVLACTEGREAAGNVVQLAKVG